MESTEPVDHGEPPTEAETHQHEKQEIERLLRAIGEDLERRLAALLHFNVAIQSMQASLSDVTKDMMDRLLMVYCRSSPKLDIEDSLHEPLRLKMETLRAANTYEGDPTADILLFPFCNQLCSAYCTASNELRDSASNCWSVVWRLTQHNVGKDGDHIKEHVNVDIERYEASLSAFRRDLAKCAADTFNSVRRTIGALRDTFEQLRLEAKKNCDGSDVQRFYSPMSRCEQYYFLIALAERIQKPPFSDGTHTRRNRELRHNLEAAMFLLSFEEQREWIRKVYELVDVKVREDLQKAFPSDFAETLQD